MSTAPIQQRLQTLCLIVICIVVTGGALYWLKPVIIPFILAVFFTFCLTPIIDLQGKYLKFPRWVAIIFTIIIGLGILALFGLLVSSSGGQISERSDIYQARIQQLLNDVSAALPLENFGIEPDKFTESVLGIIPSDTVTNLLSSTLSGVMTVLSNGMLVVIFMIFLVLGQKDAHPQQGGILSEIESRIKKYVLTMSMMSAITGFLVGATLAILGVEFAWIFGILAFFLNFIPNIGSLIATFLPLPVALLSPELSLPAKILALGIPALIQFGMGNIVQPKIMGGSLDLHPAVILLFLIFFGMIWGIVGMFLAAPMAAVVKIVLERFSYTAPFAEVLAGRFESLSQRYSGN